MGNGMVSMRDYEGLQGFDMGSRNDLEELNKALSAGTQNPPTSGGNVLRVQSLEATLRIVTTTQEHIRFWREVPKLPAFSTVEEYNRLTDYGADSGAFTDEGDLPESQDSTYERKSALVKFLGTTREVTHPMTMVRPAHGNAIALETQNGTQWLLERLEKALFTGDSNLISQEIDGLAPQILAGVGIADANTDLYDATDTIHAGAETVVIDMRGGDITETEIEVAANNIVNNYGVPTNLYTTPTGMSSLAQQFYPRERVNLPAPQNGRVGFAVTEFVSSAGLIKFNPDVFLRPGRKQGSVIPPASATSVKAPSAPTFASAAAATDAKSMFKAADAATYYWKATALNRYGESAPSAATTGQAIAAGEAVTTTVTDGGGSYAATAYRIYRATSSTGVFKLVTTIKRAGATSTYIDRNWLLPGMGVNFMVQSNLQNMAVRQLAPLMKIPLATVAASIRWMQLLYLTFILYTPKKNVIFINVPDRTV